MTDWTGVGTRTSDDTSVELEMIYDVYEVMGDTDSSDRHISLASMWRFLRMAVEDTDSTLDGWAPTAITAQSDFVISPVPSDVQKKAIKACMLWMICERDYKGLKDDGVGIVWRGGMDSIDSKTLLIEAGKAMESAERKYKKACMSYNAAQAGGTYALNDVYSKSRDNTITVN